MQDSRVFLVIPSTTLKKAKLVRIGLWPSLRETSLGLRFSHPAWGRYCRRGDMTHFEQPLDFPHQQAGVVFRVIFYFGPYFLLLFGEYFLFVLGFLSKSKTKIPTLSTSQDLSAETQAVGWVKLPTQRPAWTVRYFSGLKTLLCLPLLMKEEAKKAKYDLYCFLGNWRTVWFCLSGNVFHQGNLLGTKSQWPVFKRVLLGCAFCCALTGLWNLFCHGNDETSEKTSWLCYFELFD